ncbi:MAG: hypothetical protein JWL90_1355 [Chthoniobacteraceae bacterium]|nr:hypothetical protein [Chthoniobacteraceae bacterium]
MNLLPHECFAELIGILRDGLLRRGFHFFSGDELSRLWEPASSRCVKLEQIRTLAEACGAKFEADARFSTARFVPLKKAGVQKPQKGRRLSDMAAWPGSAADVDTIKMAA